VLKAADKSAACDMPVPEMRPAVFEVKYVRDSGKLTLAIDGKDALAADAGTVFTAPFQVTVGENRIAPGTAGARFPGPIRVLKKAVGQEFIF
jgi:hypothetical protein